VRAVEIIAWVDCRVPLWKQRTDQLELADIQIDRWQIEISIPSDAFLRSKMGVAESWDESIGELPVIW
jgi:hypothetical protein